MTRSSGTVDVQSIVAYHERISRTADLVGIKPPAGRSENRRRRRSFSSSDSYSSSSDSDSDSSRTSINIKTKRAGARKSRHFPVRSVPPPPAPGTFRQGPGPLPSTSSPLDPVPFTVLDPATKPGPPPALPEQIGVSLRFFQNGHS